MCNLGLVPFFLILVYKLEEHKQNQPYFPFCFSARYLENLQERLEKKVERDAAIFFDELNARIEKRGEFCKFLSKEAEEQAQEVAGLKDKIADILAIRTDVRAESSIIAEEKSSLIKVKVYINISASKTFQCDLLRHFLLTIIKSSWAFAGMICTNVCHYQNYLYKFRLKHLHLIFYICFTLCSVYYNGTGLLCFIVCITKITFNLFNILLKLCFF